MTDNVTISVKSGVTSDGIQKVGLTIGSGYIALDAAQLSDLITALAAERAKMQPPCPWQPPKGLERVSYSGDRAWSLPPTALGEVLLLHLHHPGYGQLRFGFTRDRYLEFRDGVNIRVAALENQQGKGLAQ